MRWGFADLYCRTRPSTVSRARRTAVVALRALILLTRRLGARGRLRRGRGRSDYRRGMGRVGGGAGVLLVLREMYYGRVVLREFCMVHGRFTIAGVVCLLLHASMEAGLWDSFSSVARQ